MADKAVGTSRWSWKVDGMVVVALLVVCAGLSIFQEADVDLGFHIKTGEHVLRTGTIPQKDIFSYTNAHKEWPLHYWMPDVLMYWVYARWGISGLILGKSAVVCLIFVVLYAGMRRIGIVWPLALLVVVWVVVMARPRFSVRPLLGSQLFLSVLAAWWMSYRAGKGWSPRFLPVLLMVWANVHAGFVYGLILLAGTSGMEVLKRVLARGFKGEPRGLAPNRIRSWALWSVAGVGAAALVVGVMNPKSLEGLMLPFRFYTSRFFMSYIGEYGPISLPRDILFAILLLATGAGFVVNRRRLDWTEVALTLGFGYLAVTSVRIVIVYGIVISPILARNLQSGFAESVERVRKRFGPRANLAVAGVVSCLLVLGAWMYAGWDRSFRPGFGFDERTFPEKAFRFIEEKEPNGEIFNSDMWGGPMILRLYPRYRVFIDGRQEVYGETFWRDVYFRVLAGGPGWEEVLERYRVNLVLLRHSGGDYGHRISDLLWESPEWVLVYWDDLTSLYAREEARNREILEGAYRVFNPDGFDLERIVAEGLLADAMEELRRAVERDPQSWRARLSLGQSYLADHDSQSARAEFRAILDGSLMEQPAAAWIGLGDAYLGLGAADSARVCYDRVRGSRAVSEVRMDLREIEMLGAEGRIAEAERKIERLPAGDGRARGSLVLGRVLMDGGHAESAVLHLEQAARENSRNAQVHYMLALAYEGLGRVKEAEGSYRAAVACRADFAEALNNLAWLVAQDRERIGEAEGLASRASDLSPGNPQVLDTLGWIQFLGGRAEAAGKTLADAVGALGPSLETGDAEILYHLGVVRRERGDPEGAREVLNRALSADPLHADARGALEEIEASTNGR